MNVITMDLNNLSVKNDIISVLKICQRYKKIDSEAKYFETLEAKKKQAARTSQTTCFLNN